MTDQVRAQINRLTEAAQGIQDIAGRFAEEHEKSIARARRDLAGRLNQFLRAMRQAQSAAEWREMLLDGAAAFSDAVILLRVDGENLVLEGVRGAPHASDPAILSPLPIAASPAIRHAMETAETVVVAKVASELDPRLIALCQPEATRAYLLPLIAGKATLAILVAEAVTEPNALEVIVSAAALALKEVQAQASAFVAISSAPASESDDRPSWDALPRRDQETHLRAQRFARVKVAEMHLYQPQAVEMGRRARNLFTALKPQIEAARSEFQEQFMSASESMVDYVHLELVRNLAANDETLLGADYPGPLV